MFSLKTEKSARTNSAMPVLPKGFKYWWRGACVPAALLVMGQLVEGRDFVVQGMVRFARRDIGACWHEHTWMEIDGEIYDPTLVQFRVLKSFRPDPFRNVVVRFGADDWRRQVAQRDLLFWAARVCEFGGRISLVDLGGLTYYSHPLEEQWEATG